MFSLDISIQNVYGTNVPSVVGLIYCQEECKRNKGTVTNICCEHQFPYSILPPFSLTLCLPVSPSVCSICVPSMHWLGVQHKVVAIAV